MKNVKTFLNLFLGSLIPEKHFYQKIIKLRLLYSLIYLSILTVFLSLLFNINLFFRYNPRKINNLINTITDRLEMFPDNLVINLKKGNLLTTYNRPYFFWIDYDQKKNLLFVIDESSTPQKIREYQSYVLITSKEMVVRNERTNTVFPLSLFGDLIVNKETTIKFRDFLQNLADLLLVIYPFIFLGLIFIIPALSLLINIMYLLILSLIFFGLFKFFTKKHITYKKTFQLSLHAVTFPLTLSYCVQIVKPGAFCPLFLFIALLAIFIFTSIYEAYFNPVNAPHPNHKTSSSTHHHHPTTIKT